MPVEDLRAGGLGEGGEFAQGVLGVGEGAFGPEAGQHDALKAQLPVFDLGDVFEFGGQPGVAAQGVAFLEVLLVAVEVAVLLVQAGDRLRLAEHRRGRPRRQPWLAGAAACAGQGCPWRGSGR